MIWALFGVLVNIFTFETMENFFVSQLFNFKSRKSDSLFNSERDRKCRTALSKANKVQDGGNVPTNNTNINLNEVKGEQKSKEDESEYILDYRDLKPIQEWLRENLFPKCCILKCC